MSVANDPLDENLLNHENGDPSEQAHTTVSMDSLDDKNGPAKIAVLMILTYFVLGIVYYTQFASPDKYSFVDAVYLIVVTITTVGYGDVNTKYNDTQHWQQMLFTSFFVFLGVGIVGAALGIVMGWVLDKEEEALQASEEESETHTLMGINVSEVQAKLGWSLCTVACLVAIGSLCYSMIEDTTVIQAFYWSSVTITTVGYGDVSPQTDGGKWFAIGYLLIGTVLMAKALGDIAALPLEMRRKKMEAKVLAQYGGDLDPEELTEIASDPVLADLGLDRMEEGTCSRIEFVMSMLLKLEKIDKDDVRRCVKVFNGLDADGSGSLNAADVAMIQDLRESEIAHVNSPVSSVKTEV